MYNPHKVSTRNNTQFNEDINVRALVNDTIRTGKKIVQKDNIIKYEKSYGFNISTKDTPTGEMRVFLNQTKPERSAHFPYYPKKK